MNERTKLMQRAAERFGPPVFTLRDLLERRDRKRRRQRISAVAVAVAVFVAPAVLIVAGIRTDRPRLPVDTVPTPAPSYEPRGPEPWPSHMESPPTAAALPVEGAMHSTPASGRLVLSVLGRGVTDGYAPTYLFLYEDGRLIWSRRAASPAGMREPNTGLFEQHLTPEGVELLRNEVIASGLFGHDDVLVGGEADPRSLAFFGGIRVWNGERFVDLETVWNYVGPYEEAGDTYEGDTIATAEQERALRALDARLADVTAWLPASAWVDPTIREYVPATYQVCYGGASATIGREAVLNPLPEAVSGVLGSAPPEPRTLPGGEFAQYRVTRYCPDIPTEEVRVIIDAMAIAGIERLLRPSSPDPGLYAGAVFDYEYVVGFAGAPGKTAVLGIDPNLPHGEAVCIVCG
jgi:hypothetical protein